MDSNKLQKEQNRIHYMFLISRYAPAYEGSLQPLSLSELRGLQLFGENPRAWKLLHGHWRLYTLNHRHAWADQARENHQLVKELEAEIARKLDIMLLKGRVLRKLGSLIIYYGWLLINQKRRLQQKTFLKETGLGSYFYRMHKAGWKHQI